MKSVEGKKETCYNQSELKENPPDLRKEESAAGFLCIIN